jgi:HK97 family phage prohead protease
MKELHFREYAATEIRDANDNERSFSHAISDESVDAHGSIIKVDGWDLKRFKANPVVLFAHDSFGLPIGRSMKIWKEDSRLMTRTQFAGMDQQHPFAETAYKLVRDGFLRAWSVGFQAKKSIPREDLNEKEKYQLADPFVHLEQELMEYSLVPVPSNPHALLDARAAGHNVDPILEWFDQYRNIAQFYEARGIALPGLELPKPPPADDQGIDEEVLELLAVIEIERES